MKAIEETAFVSRLKREADAQRNAASAYTRLSPDDQWLADEHVIDHLRAHRGSEYHRLFRTIRDIEAEASQYRLGWNTECTVVVDRVGVGQGVFDLLEQRGLTPVEFIGNAAHPDDRYANNRAGANWTVRDAMFSAGLPDPGADSLAVPSDDLELREELFALSWFTNNRDRLQLAAKDDIRGLIGRSPNRADALAMAAWQASNGCGIGGSVLAF